MGRFLGTTATSSKRSGNLEGAGEIRLFIRRDNGFHGLEQGSSVAGKTADDLGFGSHGQNHHLPRTVGTSPPAMIDQFPGAFFGQIKPGGLLIDDCVHGGAAVNDEDSAVGGGVCSFHNRLTYGDHNEQEQEELDQQQP